MEKRLGVIAILLTDTSGVHKLNGLLSDYADMMLGRQGFELYDITAHPVAEDPDARVARYKMV